MGGFSVRIFAQPNFENVTGIGLHTSFEEMKLSYSLLQISSWEVFLTGRVLQNVFGIRRD